MSVDAEKANAKRFRESAGIGLTSHGTMGGVYRHPRRVMCYCALLWVPPIDAGTYLTLANISKLGIAGQETKFIE